MTESGESSTGPGKGPGAGASTAKKPASNPLEQFVLFAAFIGGMMILINPGARDATGAAVGFVLEPLIGFGHALPVFTVLFASMVMVLTTSSVRHYFTDYLKLARHQEVMKTFNKALRDARKENNLHRMKKLTEKNKEIMALQAEQSSAQLKPMALTMIVVIPIFAWLFIFLDPGGASHALASGAANPGCETVGRVPWDATWCMDLNIQWSVLGFIPRWVAVYSLFSIPLGQVVGRLLKARDLKAELAKIEAGRA